MGLDLDYFGNYAFFGNFEDAYGGFGEERWFGVGGASWVNVEVFAFPFYVWCVSVSVDKDVEVVLAGEFAHFVHAQLDAGVVHDADFPFGDF